MAREQRRHYCWLNVPSRCFEILPALTSQMGEAASAPNSLISTRQRGGERVGERGESSSGAGATGELTGAVGVCSVTGRGFNPTHPPIFRVKRSE